MLKKLELIGFKSFPEKTTFDFTGGIIAVVGPNGCGKSNISDAIRWVLGEHRAKSLRGDKMEDFVFSGTQAKKPMNVAEVSLTLDNSNNFLNLDYQEVTVTRKFYRSGDSEYLLNKTPCRLKDIQEIFMDTGLGKDTYSIISQGEIDKILSASPVERRYLFEEASGILKHKSRKQEALKRLDETRDNLDRVSDIVEELQQQLPGLEEQAEQAKKYQELNNKLTNLEVNLLAHKIEEKRKKWYELDERQKQMDYHIEQKTIDLKKQEAELETDKTKLQQIEKDIESYQQTNISIVSEIEQKQGQDKILDERWENLEKEKQRLAEDQQQLQSQVADIQNKSHDLNNQIESLHLERKSKCNRLRQVEAKIDELSRENQDLDNSKATLIEVINRKQHLEAEYNNQCKEHDRLRHENRELEEEISSHQSRISELEVKTGQLETKHEQKQSKLNEISHNMEARQKQLDERESRHNNLTERINELNRLLQGYKSRYEALTELYKTDSFSRGVQEVIRLKQQDPAKWHDIKGTVSQLLSTDNKYAKAIETALGQSMQNVVTKTDKVAKSVLEYLKQYNKGRATCLPLDNLKPRFLNRNQKQILCNFNITGIGSELVKVSPEYQVIADHLLARVVVVSDLRKGLDISKKLGFSLKIVTLDGELILPGGAMVGGSHKKSSTSGSKLLQNEDQETLEDKISRTQTDLEKLQKSRDTVIEEIKTQKSELEKYSREKHQLELELGSIIKDREKLTEEEQNINEQIEVSKLKKQDKDNQLSALLNDMTNKKQEMKNLQKQEHELREEIDSLESEFAKSSAEYQSLSNEKSQLDIEIGKFDERLKNLNEEKKELDKQLQDYKDYKIPNNSEELEQLEQKISTTISEKKNNKIELDRLYERQGQLSGQLDQMKSDRESLRSKVQEWEAANKTLSQEERELEKQISQLKMQKSRVQNELSTILTRLEEQYQMSYEQAFKYQKPIDNYQDQEGHIKKLQNEMADLGTVNLAAIEEYNRLKERLEFLQAQRSDLQNAEQSLKQLLTEIDNTMKDSFAKTVDEINHAFGSVYKEIYQGGTAYLEYTDKDDLLNTGIEIIAKPPGKKKQILSLLSGGERALTVISLLFSVHQIKPTPFCILDEIDASLDESNLDILTRYLKEYANKTQFIVITHRKKTMLAADRFYGVTMSEPGISQLISVKLDEDDITETA